MTVETRYIVMRNGVEVQTFVNRKEADDYDKMLDMAYAISLIIESSTVQLTEEQQEELSIHLAKNKDKIIQAFVPKKIKPVPISVEERFTDDSAAE